ncbi:MAG: hypothetical protein AAF797_15605 [Planctomycetota bacterium]
MSEPSPTDAAVVRRPDAVATGPTPDRGSTPKVKRKKSWLVRLVGAGIVLVLLLAGLVLALPLIVSSGWGTQRVLAYVNEAIPGTVEVDDLRVGWLSPIEIDGLRYRDEDGVERVSAEGVLMETRPIDLLGGLGVGFDLGTVRVSGVKAEVVRETDDAKEAKSRSDKAKDEASEPAEWPEGLRVRVMVEDATVRLVSPGQRDVVISTQAPAVVDARDIDELKAELAVTVVSGRRSGAMTVDATVRGLVDASGLIRPERSEVSLKAGLTAVPTPMIARLGDLPEILPALIGPVVDVSLEAEGMALSPTATLSVKSERLDVDVAMGVSESGLVVDPSATRAEWLVLPAAWALLTGEGSAEDEAGEAVELMEPVRLTVGVERLELPVTDGVPEMSAAALRGSVSFSDAAVRLNGGASGAAAERWRLLETKILVGGEPLGERLAVVATGSAAEVLSAGPSVPPESWRLGVTLDDPLGDAARRVTGSGEVPTALLSMLTDEPRLTSLLGPMLAVSLEAELPEADGLALPTMAKVGVKSTRLDAQLALGVSEGVLRADPSATRVSYVMTPAALELLTAEASEGGSSAKQSGDGVALLQPVRVTVGVERLEVPVADGELDMTGVAVRGSVSLGDAEVRVGGKRWRLSETKVLVGGEPVGERLAVVASGLAGERVVSGPAVRSEAWRLSLGWDEPLEEGLLRVSGGGEVPTALVAVLADEPDLPAMLGDRLRLVDLKASRFADGGSALSGRLEGADSYAEFGVSLSAGKLLTLSRPSEAKLPLNRTSVGTYLKLLMPLLVGLEGSERSALLKVSDTGFKADLAQGFDVRRLAGGGELEIETTAMTEQSELWLLWQLLQRFGWTGQGVLEVAFEPVRFNAADGKLRYEEGSLTIGSVRMVLSGVVDLETESALIVLDVPAESLRKLLDLKQIRDDDSLRVQMTGKIGDLKFDREKLLREIAGLTAREAIKGDDPEDELLRNLIDRVIRQR